MRSVQPFVDGRWTNIVARTVAGGLVVSAFAILVNMRDFQFGFCDLFFLRHWRVKLARCRNVDVKFMSARLSRGGKQGHYCETSDYRDGHAVGDGVGGRNDHPLTAIPST